MVPWQIWILILALAVLLVWGTILLFSVITRWKKVRLGERNYSVDHRLKENVIIGIHDEGERLILNEVDADAGKFLIDRAHKMIVALGPGRQCYCPWAEEDRLAEEVQS